MTPTTYAHPNSPAAALARSCRTTEPVGSNPVVVLHCSGNPGAADALREAVGSIRIANATLMSEADKHAVVQLMDDEGGSFVNALAGAWRKADPENRQRIEMAFDDVFWQYGRRVPPQPVGRDDDFGRPVYRTIGCGELVDISCDQTSVPELYHITGQGEPSHPYEGRVLPRSVQ